MIVKIMWTWKQRIHEVFGLVALVSFLLAAMKLSSAHADDVANVRKAWLARETRVETASFSWHEAAIIPPGKAIALPSLVESPSTRDLKQNPIPQEEIATEGVLSLKLMGSKRFRFARKGRSWNPLEGAVIFQSYITVFNETESKSFYNYDNDESRIPQGFMNLEQSDYDNLRLQPLLMFLRPSHDGVISLDQAKTLSNKARIGDTTCLILESVDKQAGLTNQYWMDPNREYIVIRVTKRRGDRIVRQMDIEYAQDSAVQWRPDGWTISRTGLDGTVEESWQATVDKAIINAGVTAADFLFNFPEGTIVTDRTKKPLEEFLVTSNGKRVITREERRAKLPYSVLKSTASSNETISISNSSRGRLLLVVLNALVLIGVVTAILWRKKVFTKMRP